MKREYLLDIVVIAILVLIGYFKFSSEPKPSYVNVLTTFGNWKKVEDGYYLKEARTFVTVSYDTNDRYVPTQDETELCDKSKTCTTYIKESNEINKLIRDAGINSSELERIKLDNGIYCFRYETTYTKDKKVHDVSIECHNGLRGTYKIDIDGNENEAMKLVNTLNPIHWKD